MGNRITGNNQFDRRSRGCIYGAFVGDALGSYREFEAKANSPTDSAMNQAMKMPGGGPFKLGQGQVTDDSELAMCLLQGIMKSNEKNKKQFRLNMDDVAFFYKKWIDSDPFDMGLATQHSIGTLEGKNPEAWIPIKYAAIYNQESMSNGALMRCTPLVVFTSGLQQQILKNQELLEQKLDEIIEIIGFDCRMSHPNKTCLRANVTYTLVIHSLLNSTQDSIFLKAQEAFNFLQQCEHKLKSIDPSNLIDEWLLEAKNLAYKSLQEKTQKFYLFGQYDATEQQGFVKHAFILSFYYLFRLKKANSQFNELVVHNYFENSLREVISLGGDTDTNACIVGGLLGAIVGESNIPEEMKKKVKKFDCTDDATGGQTRSEFLSVKKVGKNKIEELICLVRNNKNKNIDLVDIAKEK